MLQRRLGVTAALVIAAAAIGLMGACTDKFTGPKRLRPDSTRLRADSTRLRDWNAPTSGTFTLTPDPIYGSAETDSIGHYPVRTSIYIIGTGAFTQHDNYGINPDGMLGPNTGVSLDETFPNGTASGVGFSGNNTADTIKWQMMAGTALTKIRHGPVGSITRTNYYYNGQYINCGPTTTPCYTFSGAITVQIIAPYATYSAAADSAMYSIGSTAEFRLTSSPDTVVGGAVPMQIDSAMWVPASDSLGGNQSLDDSATVTGCGGFGNVNNDPPHTIYHCFRSLHGAGTMTFVAHANGYRTLSNPVPVQRECDSGGGGLMQYRG